MKSYHAIIVFAVLLSGTALFSMDRYRQAEDAVLEELHRALTQTLQEHHYTTVTPDTIRDFRRHIVTPELRETAYLSLRAVKADGDAGKSHYRMQAHAGCSFAMLFGMSDQRGTWCLLAVTLLWGIGSIVWLRKHRQPLSLLFVGNLGYDEDTRCFYTKHCPERVPLTPMQRDLMRLFFDMPSHTLEKTTICDALWPKKPDASETLYTLVRRLKIVLREHSNLEIDNSRGQSYTLRIRDVGNCQ